MRDQIVDAISSASAWRRGFGRFVLLLLTPLLVLMLAEGVLKLINFGVPSRLYLVDEWGGRTLATENNHFTRKYFGPSLERSPWMQAFPVPKPANEFRVFVLGESAALGDPIPEYGMSRILETLLQDKMTNRRVRVINTAITAINSHVIVEIASEVARLEPDAVVIYAGNNEIVGPYGPGTVFTGLSKHRWFIRLATFLRGTRAGQLYVHLAHQLSPPQENSWRGMEMFLERQVERDDPALMVAYQLFEKNLTGILNTFTRANIPVVLSSVSVNLGDCAPLASPQPGDEANQSYLQAKEREASGDSETAMRLYREALELDTLRFRADTRINEVITETAAMYSDRHVTFVDAEQIIAAQSDLKIPGEKYFYDHVHLNFSGQYLLAKSFSAALIGRDDWLSEDDVAVRVGWGNWSDYNAWLEMYTRRLMPPFMNQVDREENEARWADQLIVLSKKHSVGEHTQKEVAAIKSAMEYQGEEDPELWRQLALAYMQAGNLRESARAFSHISKLLPHRTEFTLSHAALLAATGRAEDAVRFMRVLPIWRAAKEDRLLSLMARQLVAWNLVAQAEPLFERAWLINPSNPEALAGLGTSRAASGSPNEGIAMLESARQQLKADDRVAANLGIALYETGHLQAAIEQLEEALRINPDNAETRISLALMYRDQRQYEKARELMDTALIQRPLDIALLDDAAMLAETQMRWADAIRYFKRALRLNPADASLWFKLSRAQAAQGDYHTAEKTIRKSMEIDPDNLATIYLASQIFLQTEARAEGVSLLKQAVHTSPQQDGWKMNLAWLLATHPDETLRDPSSALEVAGALSKQINPMIRADIKAAALAAAGNTSEAARILAAALGADESVPGAFAQSLETRLQLYLEGRSYVASWDEFVPE